MKDERPNWPPEHDAILRAEYATASTADLAARLGKPAISVRRQAVRLGLAKDPEAIAQRCRENGRLGAAASNLRWTSGAPTPPRDIGRDSPAYQRKVREKAERALRDAGLDASDADVALRAIVAGRVPGVRIEY